MGIHHPITPDTWHSTNRPLIYYQGDRIAKYIESDARLISGYVKCRGSLWNSEPVKLVCFLTSKADAYPAFWSLG
jgi:hypothetical protein